MLSICLFGRFAVEIDAQPVDDKAWERRAATSLVKLLALAAGHTLHRDQVAEQLWPRQAPDAANNSLNKAIHAARRALEPELHRGPHSRFILTPRNQVVLASPGQLQVDVSRFEQAANQALREQDAVAAQAALNHYGGTLLVDDLYEEWTSPHRDLTRSLFRTTSRTAAQLFAARGEPAQGIEITRRLILEEPADESTHVLLMQLLMAAGQPDAAEQHVDMARSMLAAAGVEPGPELRALAASLKPHRPGPGALPGADRAPAARPAVETQEAEPEWLPHIEPVSFRPGLVKTARWCPNGSRLVVNAKWDGQHFNLYRIDTAGSAAETLPWRDVELFAIGPQGQLVLGLDRRPINPVVSRCTLVTAAEDGGSPITWADDVEWADWRPMPSREADVSPGQALAIVRSVAGLCRLEFPIGTPLYESAGWISHPRFSPSGRHIAFFDHPIHNDDEADVLVIEMAAGAAGCRVLSRGLDRACGLAWRADAVWFTATRKGLTRSLYRVDLSGQEYCMHRGLAQPRLQDVGPNAALLVSNEQQIIGTVSRHASEPFERDISWHAYTTPRDISADGKWLLVEECNTVGRHRFSAWLRRIDGTATRSLGDGVPLVLGPDQRTVVLRIPGPPSHLAVLDVYTGRRCALGSGSRALTHTEFVSFFPDGQRMAFSAADAEHGLQIYLQDLVGGDPVCFRPGDPGLSMTGNRAVSPDGQSLMLLDARGQLGLYPLDGGPPRLLPGLDGETRVAAWHHDGRAISVYSSDVVPAQVDLYDVTTGERRPWLTLKPDNGGTVTKTWRLRMTADGLSHAYAYLRESADLFRFSDV